ncbi:pyridine nucleotide-disulfide oxidoreductase family protein [Anopheles sinensis]|uniref:Pyridine nucleotide-disulfide oxidoreductase family protein n=1 Tax=Anopheles sinensis TaxID=74873 RepID=A0A084WKW1_ANOSI|nr:pyridine nucleotide-disulfide oxidoreductase family protein [Anopheles sinensis]
MRLTHRTERSSHSVVLADTASPFSGPVQIDSVSGMGGLVGIPSRGLKVDGGCFCCDPMLERFAQTGSTQR